MFLFAFPRTCHTIRFKYWLPDIILSCNLRATVVNVWVWLCLTYHRFNSFLRLCLYLTIDLFHFYRYLTSYFLGEKMILFLINNLVFATIIQPQILHCYQLWLKIVDKLQMKGTSLVVSFLRL